MNTLDENVRQKVEALHAHKMKICLVCTGAGAGCQNILTQVPGASGTVLECIFPYSKESLTDFLGEEPKQFVSEQTALRMAAKAWRRATEILARQKSDIRDAVGIAVTGAIATNRALRGEHRVFIAARTAEGFFKAHIVFAKKTDGLSVLGRIREGHISDIMTLNMILHCVGIPQIGIAEVGISGDVTQENVVLYPRKVEQDARIDAVDPEKHVLFEGSFNPLHHGHEQVRQEVERLTGKKVVYVITNRHPDKGNIGDDDLRKRLEQFQWLAPVLATDGLRLYADKAKAFPGFAFIVGADTLRRILDQKYYSVPIEEVLQVFEDHRTHFFVANRPEEDRVVTLDSLRKDIPLRYQNMFTQISTTVQVSSTALRRA